MATYKVAYKPTAEQIRKLGDLQSQMTHCFQASKIAWRNHDYDTAIELHNQANAACSALNAYFGKLCNWRNNGVRTDYLK